MKILRVTDKGKSICEQAEKSMAEMPAKALNGFSSDEKNTLNVLLKRLLKNIEQAK